MRVAENRFHPDLLRRQQLYVARAREDGFAIIDQEVELGLRSIAVPLIDKRGRTIAALNIGLAATSASAQALADSFLPKLLTIQSGLRRVL